MGYVQERANGSFRARWVDPTGKLQSKTFANKRDAQRFVRNQQTDIDRGVYVDSRGGQVTFGEWAEHYMGLAEKRLARTSFVRDRSYLDNHVLPRWGRTKLSRIARSEVE